MLTWQSDCEIVAEEAAVEFAGTAAAVGIAVVGFDTGIGLVVEYLKHWSVGADFDSGIDFRISRRGVDYRSLERGYSIEPSYP